MRKTHALPDTVKASWWCEAIEHSADREFPKHYHEMDEWIRITRGSMVFTEAASGQPIEAAVGDCVAIPAGHVHSLRIGATGAKYDMWTPEQTDEAFMKQLRDGPAQMSPPNERQLAVLVQKNFEIPLYENRAAVDSSALKSLKDLLHPSLVFRRANGLIEKLEDYVERVKKASPGPQSPNWTHRWGSTGLEILHLTAQSAVVSIVVHTVETNQESLEGRRSAYRNLRTFVLEEGCWKCLVWVNYPVSATKSV